MGLVRRKPQLNSELEQLSGCVDGERAESTGANQCKLVLLSVPNGQPTHALLYCLEHSLFFIFCLFSFSFSLSLSVSRGPTSMRWNAIQGFGWRLNGWCRTLYILNATRTGCCTLYLMGGFTTIKLTKTHNVFCGKRLCCEDRPLLPRTRNACLRWTLRWSDLLLIAKYRALSFTSLHKLNVSVSSYIPSREFLQVRMIAKRSGPSVRHSGPLDSPFHNGAVQPPGRLWETMTSESSCLLVSAYPPSLIIGLFFYHLSFERHLPWAVHPTHKLWSASC